MFNEKLHTNLTVKWKKFHANLKFTGGDDRHCIIWYTWQNDNCLTAYLMAKLALVQ